MTGEWVDAVIVLVIVLATVGIGYAREYRAEAAAAALQARVRSRARVLRDGQPIDVPTEEIVPGDVVLLSAGSLVPADGADSRGDGLLRQRGGPDRRELPGREAAGTGGRHRRAARPAELRLSRHQRAERHGALPDRRRPAWRPSSAPSRTA